jgi:catechol 2,3-dioxygenase-like lactoylglutathione lyase family enzyme
VAAGDTAGPVIGIDHLAVRVADLDQAITLLTDRLGLRLISKGVGADRATPVAFIACGGAELELFEAPGHGDDASLDHIGLRVDGTIGDAIEALRARGVESRGDEIAAARDRRAIWLNPETTLGLPVHLIAS